MAAESLRRSDRARAVGVCFATPTADSVAASNTKVRRRVGAAKRSTARREGRAAMKVGGFEMRRRYRSNERPCKT